MKRVLVVQHERFEGPGTLGEALAGLELRFLRTFAGDPIPKTLEEDALVVLGGGMGVYDRDRLPHLNDEIALYAAAMAAAKPVLGICLGSQLLAAALGADRPHWAEREVRLARVDDHLERRPDEMELARRLSVAVSAPFAELAQHAVRDL